MQRAPVSLAFRPTATKSPAALRVVAALWGLSALIVAVGFDVWTPSQVTLLVVPSIAAWMVRRRSLLVSLCLAQTAIYYGLTSFILAQDRPPGVAALVVIWTAGLTLGPFVVRGGGEPPTIPRAWTPPGWPQLALTTALIALQANLNLSGSAGYASQLTSGLSTPTGITGILTSAAPLVVIMFIVSALGSQRWMWAAVALGTSEAVVLSLSGFRGAGVLFVIAVVVAAALILPTPSPWRRPRRAAAVLCVLAILAVALFAVGASVRNTVATQLHFASQGTQLFGLDQAVPIVAGRLDLGSTLDEAVLLQDNLVLKDAVSWTTQIQAFIPRFLWSDKPVVNYGQEVAAVVYGDTTGTSSNSITSIGDVLVNFGILGVIAGSVILGLLLTFLERRIRNGASLVTLVLAAGLAYTTGAWEIAPLILTIVGLTQGLLVAGFLWLGIQALHLSSRPEARSGRLPYGRQPVGRNVRSL